MQCWHHVMHSAKLAYCLSSFSLCRQQYGVLYDCTMHKFSFNPSKTLTVASLIIITGAVWCQFNLVLLSVNNVASMPAGTDQYTDCF